MLAWLASGLLAGLAGGLFLAAAFSVVVPSSPGLPMMPMMALLASRLGLDGMAAGWAIVLGLSAVVGMALAAGLGRRMRDAGTVSSVAFFVGLGLWLVEAAMVPLLFGEPPSAIVTNPSMWPAAMMLLVATLLFTSIVAGVLLAFRGRPRATTTVETEDLRRAA